MDIRINSYIPITNVEGVGTRFAIWVQGCPIRCEGCANSHMWNSNGGKNYRVSEFLQIIKTYANKIEGITWLGGEPLAQIMPVIEISKEVQNLGLSVITFTGYDYNEIKTQKDVKELVKYTDILIDGKFEKDKLDYSRAWVGSKNQNYYFFSDKYNQSVITKYKNKFEVRITPDNKVIMSGMGDFNKLKKAIKFS
jgi:anaerobic ribonucleoside-triphosphate reductase activating protein